MRKAVNVRKKISEARLRIPLASPFSTVPTDPVTACVTSLCAPAVSFAPASLNHVAIVSSACVSEALICAD